MYWIKSNNSYLGSEYCTEALELHFDGIALGKACEEDGGVYQPKYGTCEIDGKLVICDDVESNYLVVLLIVIYNCNIKYVWFLLF